MVSILIPTYNYNVFPLVKLLHQQALDAQLTIEIRVYDDASTVFFEENERMHSLTNVIYKKCENNKGRTALRNQLAQDAVYDALLFMDADVMPEGETFLQTQIASLTPEIDLVFGGIRYTKQVPERAQMLRWKYGKQREAKTIERRREMPYLSIISQCFLLRKVFFLKANDCLENMYGLDVLFSANLKANNVRVAHIENPIVHHGLESSSTFIEKTKLGIETLYKLTNQKCVSEDFRPIQKAYLKLKKTGTASLYIWVLGLFQKTVLKNLMSKNPSLFLFDLYRLFLYTKLKENDG